MKSFIIALAAAASVAALQTQSNAQPAPAASSGPRVTITGWHLECAPTSTKAACRILNQVAQAQGGALLVAFTITPETSGKTDLTVQVPLGASVAVPIAVDIPGETTQTLPYLTCSQQGCFATAPLDTKLLGAMRGGKAELKTTYTLLDAALGAHAVTVNLPMTGFSELYDKLK